MRSAWETSAEPIRFVLWSSVNILGTQCVHNFLYPKFSVTASWIVVSNTLEMMWCNSLIITQLFIISACFLCIYKKMVSCNSHCAMLLAAAEHLMPTHSITQPHGFTSDHTQGSTRLHMVQIVHAPSQYKLSECILCFKNITWLEGTHINVTSPISARKARLSLCQFSRNSQMFNRKVCWYRIFPHHTINVASTKRKPVTP